MFCVSSAERSRIRVNLSFSLKSEVLSRFSFSAMVVAATSCGSTPPSCLLTCGVTLGARAPASFSNSALVMIVLQSAAGAFVAAVFVAAVFVAAVAGFAAVPLTVAVFGCAAQTPVMVITAALSGTDADVSGPAGACCIGGPACGLAIGLGAWPALPGTAAGVAGGGVPGAACPQARVPNRTHSSQLLRITLVLQGLVNQGLVHQEIEKYQASNPSTTRSFCLAHPARSGDNASMSGSPAISPSDLMRAEKRSAAGNSVL